MKFKKYIVTGNNRVLKFFSILFPLFIYLPGFASSHPEVDSIKNSLAPGAVNQTKPDTATINTLNKLAANYFKSNPDSAYYYGKKSIELSRKIKYKVGIANGLLQTGHVNYFKGNSLQARQDFDEAIKIFKLIHDDKGLSNCYILYGRLYNLVAEYNLALASLNKALKIATLYNDEETLTEAYKSIGIVYFSKGQLSNALDFYYKALFISLKNNYKTSAAEVYNDIGVVLQNMEVYPNALDYFKKAIQVFEATNNTQAVGTANENIGEVLTAQTKYDEAIVYLYKSLKTAKKQDDKDGLSSVYTDLGICFANKNQIVLAKAYLDTSLQIATKFKILYNQAYALNGYATVYNLLKDYKNAYKYAIKGKEYAIKLGNISVRSNSALQLNKAMAGLGKFEDANRLLNEYISLKNKINDNESIQKFTSYNFEMSFAEKKRLLAQQQRERDLIYQQKINSQRFINTIFLIFIVAMIVTATIYYRQKRKQQKINALLADRNHEILKQKTNIDDQAEKLNDLNILKDRLISILAHDLRAPLSTLRGLFDLLQDNSISHDELLEMIPNVLKKLEYTSDFLDTLLFWINSQMDNFEASVKNFSIKELVSLEIESYNEQAILKGINLVDNIPDNLSAWADANSIRIVIRNLITNALKFCRENDTIEIAAWEEDDKRIIVQVKDTGIGMPPEQRDRLFKGKVNSKVGTKNESGTGMGMLFCKDLVEKCHGKIWVISQPGVGTQFSFTLPAVAVGTPVEV
ncbi:tetratricopeptide repeat-containing sensor histidine kinase [Mucilaginibacter sp. FT3.2]|uniref:tetratricopeptide repeat-containing sensor histidine kinase n=1 Tax=Mucilaginibacter sp. FT3.2 TaxID=2723090 RepID=UPI00160B6234|nr:tetratricopeptide repeat protein [Mucilaginibacter sp. FT3.2]MBB6233350.1 signal transduction histidine kinase [Mucilaginibacter sp. FT3.2]